MKRVVITGLGLTSCLGNDRSTVTAALRAGQSGIRAMPEYAELGFRSQVAGQPEVDFEARIDRKLRRFMADTAAYTYLAMQDAIADAKMFVDGREIYTASDLRVGLFTTTDSM